MAKFYVHCPFTDENYGPYISAERADLARQAFDRDGASACDAKHEVEVVIAERQPSWIERLRGASLADRARARADDEPAYPEGNE